MFREIQNNWWLKNSKGEFISFWPGTQMLNIAAGQPEISSIKWNTYLAHIISDSILNNSRWDGVYIDNCWSTVSWKDPLMDVTGDGIADKAYKIDSLWKSGMDVMLAQIRAKYPTKIVVGNGGYAYGKYLNGALFEDFPKWGGWYRLFDTYKQFDTLAVSKQFNIINSTTSNTGKQDLRNMRFGLASALMGNGFYSYDYGANDHSQHWWFDEYDVDLGEPLEPAQCIGKSILSSNNFESGIGEWEAGDWEMTSSIIVDTKTKSNAFRVVTSGKEKWNNVLSSPQLSIGKGAMLKCSMKVSVESVDSGAILYAALRKGDDFENELSLGSKPISINSDSVFIFYCDSTVVESGYSLCIGLTGKGTVLIDDITIESTENLAYSRRFERGVVLLNPSPVSKSFSYPEYHRFKGVQDPVHNDGSSATTITLAPSDGILLVRNDLSINKTSSGISKISIITNGQQVRITSLPPENTQITLFDLTGRLLETYQFSRDEAVLLSPTIASGVFVLEIHTGLQRIAQKIQL